MIHLFGAGGTAVLLVGFCASAVAHDITAKSDSKVPPAFDITSAKATTDGRLAEFAMEVSGQAGSSKPEAIDPEVVGFSKSSGILALAVTAHPDFDDTPLYDENNDGDPANDGAGWHSHWVVLGEDKACGAGLKVHDVSPGSDMLPATGPGLPIALDSPGMSPLLKGASVRITMPLKGQENAAFDAVTAELQVNEAGKAPLLCVTGVHKIASGKLAFPGTITLKK